jgi:polygalacturonase
MNITRLGCLCIFLFSSISSLYSKDFSIVEYGAISDGVTLNTVAIQKAIDQANKEGGGRVIIPAGRFLSGSIILKSNVEVHLLKNAYLLGSTDPSDYVKLRRWKALVMANGVENIGVTGKGVVDGQGCQLALHIDSLYYVGKLKEKYYDLKEKRPIPDVRPQIIEFVNCRNIKVLGITIRNAASWVQTYDLCRNLVIDKIRVESDAYWNNDGIDIIDCKNVRITNCYVNSSDDGICLKSFRHGPYLVFCDSIYIANCTVRSSASAVKLGTSSYGGFKNIVIEKIKVYDTYRSAIALETYETGILENILIQDIKAVNTGNAIFIRLGIRLKPYFERRTVGTIKNVTIRNVKVKVPFKRPDYAYKMRGPAEPFFHNTFPSSIVGIPGHPVENVTLENIKIIYPGRGDRCYAQVPLSRLNDIPENEDHYPEFSMFGELPAWGFYVRHADGITMKRIKVKIRKPDYRPAFVFDDVKNLNMEAIRIVGDKKSDPVKLNNAPDAKINIR